MCLACNANNFTYLHLIKCGRSNTICSLWECANLTLSQELVSLEVNFIISGKNPTILIFGAVRFFTNCHPDENTESRCTNQFLYIKSHLPFLCDHCWVIMLLVTSPTERAAWFWLGELEKGRVFSNAFLEAARAGSSLGNKLGTLEAAGLVGQLSEEVYQLWEHIRSCQHSPEP